MPDWDATGSLRTEARQRLAKVRPVYEHAMASGYIEGRDRLNIEMITSGIAGILGIIIQVAPFCSINIVNPNPT